MRLLVSSQASLPCAYVLECNGLKVIVSCISARVCVCVCICTIAYKN